MEESLEVKIQTILIKRGIKAQQTIDELVQLFHDTRTQELQELKGDRIIKQAMQLASIQGELEGMAQAIEASKGDVLWENVAKACRDNSAKVKLIKQELFKEIGISSEVRAGLDTTEKEQKP